MKKLLIWSWLLFFIVGCGDQEEENINTKVSEKVEKLQEEQEPPESSKEEEEQFQDKQEQHQNYKESQDIPLKRPAVQKSKPKKDKTPKNPVVQKSKPKKDKTQPKPKPQANVKVSDQKPLLWSKILDKTETWRPRRSSSAAIAFQGKLWIFGGSSVGRKNDIWNSVDGKNWTRVKEFAEWSPRLFHAVFEFKNELWLIDRDTRPKNDIWKSADGINWTLVKDASKVIERFFIPSVTVFKNQIWIMGDVKTDSDDSSSEIWVSSNGTEWTQIAVDQDNIWEARDFHQSFVFDNKIWVAGGREFLGKRFEDIWSSVDGKVWVKEFDASQASESDSPDHIYNADYVVFDNQLWMLDYTWDDETYASSGTVWSSADGQTWQKEEQIQTFNSSEFNSLVFNHQLWVIDSAERDIWSSVDGKTWKIEVPNYWAPHHASTVFKDRIWIMGGFCGSDCWNNNVWSSADGINWREELDHAAWKPRYMHTGVAFKDRLWVIGGYQSWEADIWSSADGKTWQKEFDQTKSPERWIGPRMTSLVFKNKIWVLGAGDYDSNTDRNGKEVWSSADGKNWQKEAELNMPYSYRHSSFVFQNKIWFFPTTWIQTKDYYSSTDGQKWEKSGELPQLPNYSYVAPLGDRIWFFGGEKGQDPDTSIVYSTRDGKTWSKEKNPVPWNDQGHNYGSVLTFKDKLYLLGGFNDEKSEYENVVWQAELETE